MAKDSLEWPTSEEECARIASKAYSILGDRHASHTRKFIAESALRKLNRMKFNRSDASS